MLNVFHPVALRPPLVDVAGDAPEAAPWRAKVLPGIDSLDGLLAVSRPSGCGEVQESGVGGARGSRLVLKTSARTDLDLVTCDVLLRWLPEFRFGSLLLVVCAVSAAADFCRACRSCGSKPSVEGKTPDDVSALANVPQPPAPALENAPGNPPAPGGPSFFAELLRHVVRDSDRA